MYIRLLLLLLLLLIIMIITILNIITLRPPSRSFFRPPPRTPAQRRRTLPFDHYIYIYIYIHTRVHSCRAQRTRFSRAGSTVLFSAVANLPTNIVDFRGFGSSVILILRVEFTDL